MWQRIMSSFQIPSLQHKILYFDTKSIISVLIIQRNIKEQDIYIISRMNLPHFTEQKHITRSFK